MSSLPQAGSFKPPAGERPQTMRYRCQACGAALEVRVRFKGRLVWTIDEIDPDFSGSFPETRGVHGDPRLVCSADPLHATGFRLAAGAVEPDPQSKTAEG